MATDERSLEEIKAQERQSVELEKQSILEFEGYLAAGTRKETINDNNSLLLKSLTNLEPRLVFISMQSNCRDLEMILFLAFGPSRSKLWWA